MKWLKKDSSEDVQETIAESQPEPEQPTEQIEVENSDPEALEQPVVPMPVSPEEEIPEEVPETFETEDENIDESDSLEFKDETVDTTPAQTGRQSRRRDRKEEDVPKETKKPGFNPLTTFARTWIGKNWKVMAILVFIFCLALFVRSYYGVVPATEDGFILSGGSDSYYHNFVIDYASDTGDHHFWDDMLNYPLGTRNPRPPLYDWSVTLGGLALSPFFEDGQYEATFYVFIFSTAFWGALTIFPTYFLAREAFGKRTGMIAAFLLAVMPGHIQRSVLTNADHDAMALFFIVTTFFFFLKALKLMEQKEWISTWRKPDAIFSGVKDLVQTNRVPILYAVMAGLSLAGVALIWKGYAYVIVLMTAYFLIQLLINKFRNIDSFGVLAIYFVAVGVGLLIAFPYYFQSLQVPSWFDTPFYMFLGATAFALALIVTRKLPWILVFSGMIGIGLISVLLLAVITPSLLDTLVSTVASGAGYFIQNKQYQTIAEAQAPPFSNLAMSFGMFTFWLSFIGIAWAAIQLPKSWKSDFTFITLWTAISIYMAVTAARFMFNAGPAFAITAGWIIALLITKMDIKKFTDNMKRSAQAHMSTQFKMGMLVSTALLVVLSLVLFLISNAAYPVFVIGFAAIIGIYMLNLIAETNPNRTYNLLTALIPISGALFYILSEFYTDWEFTSATHGFLLFVLLFGYFVLYMNIRKTRFTFTAGIVFLAFFVIMPNVWGGLDAGIPYEVKNDYDLEIYESAPIFMQPSNYDPINGTNWFLGGFGYSLPLNSRYWPAAYDWLATQDTEIYPASERPAFLSWWDYGFEVVNEGDHPTVADNFLGGHQLAGNFIMSQSEADAISLLCARILEGNWRRNYEGVENHLDIEIESMMQSYGIDVNVLNDYLENPGDYVDDILAHPEIYGPRDDIIQEKNARYILLRVLITNELDEEGVVNLYNDLCEFTGNSIRYFGIDSRLFPFSADNTGIFYAPAKLSDHRIDDIGNQPYDFWEIKAIGEFGGEYDLDDIPMDVQLDQENPYKIIYNDMFYNSMLYKCFIGYSGEDVGRGEDAGIPGLTESMATEAIMPGWNMTHFKLEHRTAYWNPYGAEEIQNHTDAWQAMNFWDAYERQMTGDGISDLSDRSSLYQGVMMLKYYDGAIISGKVTMEDGTPLGGIAITVTDDFSIPHQRVVTDENGSYSIIVPYGDITLTTSIGPMDPMSLIGSELNLTSMHIEDYQAMREDEDRDNNGKPDYLIDQDIIINSGDFAGISYWDIDGDEAFTDETDQLLPDVEIHMNHNSIDFDIISTSDDRGIFNISSLPPGGYSATLSVAGTSLTTVSIIITSGQVNTDQFIVPSVSMSGTVTFIDGTPVDFANVNLFSPSEEIYFSVQTDEFGNYTFENIIQGLFTTQAYVEGYASNLQSVEVVPGENNTNDYILFESSYLSGTLRLPDDTPVPNGKMRLTGYTDFILTTDEFGNYSAWIENDIYNLYSECTISSSTYAVNTKLIVDGDARAEIYLQHGTMLNGHISNQYGASAGSLPIYIEEVANGYSMMVYSNAQGDYTVNIPKGEYVIQISSNNYVFYKTQDFTTASYNMDITVLAGTPVSGAISWDGIGLEYASVIFKEPSGEFEGAITDTNGTFSINLKPDVQYQVMISKLGFELIELGTFMADELSDGIFKSMVPVKLPIVGTLYLDDTPLENQNIILKFQSTTNESNYKEIQVGRDGNYSGELGPGQYSVYFIQNISQNNDSLVYQIDDNYEFSTGVYDGRTIELDLNARLRQNFDISVISDYPLNSNITFENGPEYRRYYVNNGSGNFYIMPGSYVVKASYADNSTIFVGMNDVIVSENSSSISVEIRDARVLRGDIVYGTEAMPSQVIIFNDQNSNGSIIVKTDEVGTFEAVLELDGLYDLAVDFVAYDGDDMKAYHYYANESMNADTSSPLSIFLEREDHYTVISGNLSNGAAGVEIVFYSLEEEFTTITDSLGHYEIALKPNVYTVHIHDQFSHNTYLDLLIVDLDSINVDFDMEKGYRIFGTAYYGLNQYGITELLFQSNISLIPTSTDENGFYEIWLPAGNYAVSSSVNAKVDGVSIRYNVSKTFEIVDSGNQMNLAMSMVEDRNVDLTYDIGQLKETPDNSTVTYKFDISNLGNIQDTYTISATGGNPDWIFELNKYEVTIDAGQDSTASITATIPEGAKISQNAINLAVVSKNDPTVSSSEIINVDIKQTYVLAIEPLASSPIFMNDVISSVFAAKNNGNGDDKVTLYIGNLDDLAANGWKAELGAVDGAELLNDNTRLFNFSIASGGVSDIPITITPIAENPSRQASVLITGYSESGSSAPTSQYIILRYPELQIYTDNVTIIGEEVSTIAAGDEMTNAGVMVMSVSVALGLFYYARKKRWIR